MSKADDAAMAAQGMYVRTMAFDPQNDLTQSELNRLTVHLMSKLFTKKGQSIQVVEERPMLMLVKFLLSLDMRMDQTVFDSIPKDLQRHFVSIERNGDKPRMGK